MKEKSFDYEKAVHIDQDNLDREWCKQSENVYVCMHELANARKELDKAKENYDLIVAEVDRYYRENSEKKPTEKALEGLVLLDPRVQEASKDVIDSKYNVNMLEAARAGLENKREALVNLVKLHGMGYFAEPAVDIQERGELEEIRQRAVREKVRKSLHKWDKDSEIKRTK